MTKTCARGITALLLVAAGLRTVMGPPGRPEDDPVFYSHDAYDKAPAGGVLVDPKGPAAGSSDHGYARMFKGFCQGRSPEYLTCTKRHARAPLLTAAIGFRCVASAE